MLETLPVIIDMPERLHTWPPYNFTENDVEAYLTAAGDVVGFKTTWSWKCRCECLDYSVEQTQNSQSFFIHAFHHLTATRWSTNIINNHIFKTGISTGKTRLIANRKIVIQSIKIQQSSKSQKANWKPREMLKMASCLKLLKVTMFKLDRALIISY